MLGHVLSQTGRHHAASLALQRARELDPLYAMHYALSAQLAFQARDFDAALEHARQSLAVDPDFWTGYHQLAQVLERRGEMDAALTAADTASRLSGGNSKALGHLGLQRAEAMFQWLDRAYDARDVHLVFAPVDPKWDPYRRERRFQQHMSRCGFTR